MDLHAQAPEAYRAMLGLEAAVRRGPLPATTLELVKVRVSQINGCAFCVDMHTHEAKDAGESDERLFSVAVWREAPFFTPAERAALGLAEEMTRLPDHGRGVSEEVWTEARAHHPEPVLAALVVAITTINAWNRLAIAARTVPGSMRKAATA